jgi:hypothetical protein
MDFAIDNEVNLRYFQFFIIFIINFEKILIFY